VVSIYYVPSSSAAQWLECVCTTAKNQGGNIAMTRITRADLPIILERYALGEFRDFKTFPHGAGQTTILLETSLGKNVLRYYQNRSREHVYFEAQLLHFLRSRNYPVPAVVKTRDGSSIGFREDKPYMILEFVDGMPGKDPNKVFDRTEAAAVTKAVAELHNLTQNHRLADCEDREVYDAAYCRRQFQKKHHRLLGTEKETWFKYELDRLQFPASLPQGICHADLNYGNFLFRDGNVIAVLDFDMSMYTHLIYDIASLMYWWTMPSHRNFRHDEAIFIVTEYSKWRKINRRERKHIYDALKLIVLLGISWSDDADFENERARVELLNSMTRENFVPP
jgi:homoserine kinase type II